VSDLLAQPQNVVVVHYSCENLYDTTSKRSPRITSIAIRKFQSGITRSFSIHMYAERKGWLDEISEHYDELERVMLDEYYEMVRDCRGYKWVHWNMRDIKFGFPSIDHRYEVLGGTPAVIPDENKVDLSRMCVAIYGIGYIGHPRLERLVELNHIGKMEFLPGSKEAELFASQQYLAVHWSTLRKADMLANILGRIGDGTLKTTASWWERNGVPLRAIPEMVKEHPIYIGLGIAAVLLAFVTRLFGVIELVERLGDPPDASAVTPAQAPAPSPSVPATLP
jgi:hypothetical protein